MHHQVCQRCVPTVLADRLVAGVAINDDLGPRGPDGGFAAIAELISLRLVS